VHDVPLYTEDSTAFCALRCCGRRCIDNIELAKAGSTEAFRELAKLEGVSPEKFRGGVARGRSSLLGAWRGLPGGLAVIGRGVYED